MEAKFLRQHEMMRRLTQNKFAKNPINEKRFENISKNTFNLARKIVGPKSNTLGPHNLLTKAIEAAQKKLVPAVTTIQRAYRKAHPMTNERFIKMFNRWQKGDNSGLHEMSVYANKKYGTENLNMVINMMYENRHHGTSPAVKKIQTAWRNRVANRTAPVKYFIESLDRDPRFNVYYTKVLTSLYKEATRTLAIVKSYPETSPRKIISRFIGACHIKANQVPTKYLGDLINQLVYVSRVYVKMPPGDMKEYRDRLGEALGGRPCLENIIEAMVEALAKPVFIWVGKNLKDPLVNNKNSRYLTIVMGPAVASWVTSKNKGSKIPNNLGARKKLFWNMVKNRPLHIRNSEGVPVFSTPAQYNRGAKRFLNSNEANSLEYF